MKTRVSPYEYDRYNNSKRWAVEVFDPNEKRGEGAWVVISNHKFVWVANWKANRLTHYSLSTKQNRKEVFVDKLKNGEEE
jgi:hypothetical protein